MTLEYRSSGKFLVQIEDGVIGVLGEMVTPEIARTIAAGLHELVTHHDDYMPATPPTTLKSPADS
jgi:hypothetical protein